MLLLGNHRVIANKKGSDHKTFYIYLFLASKGRLTWRPLPIPVAVSIRILNVSTIGFLL